MLKSRQVAGRGAYILAGGWATSRCLIYGLLLALTLFIPALDAAESLAGPQVDQFSPQGLVKRVRQASARFSEAMVPLGDPRSPIDPFEIDCIEAGVGRWIDSRTWVYDFKRDLPGGLSCRFQVRAGLETQAGKLIAGQMTFAFTTGGPAILNSIPSKDATIDEDQAFVLTLDAQPTEESVLQHVAFVVAGLPERIGVRPITGEAREAILRSLAELSGGQHTAVLQARQKFPSARTSAWSGKRRHR
jgi:hypothetical protein